MLHDIVVHGARQHNLKNIDVTIPRNRLVVITGISGSGKSSLAFDTIYAEGQRRYVESLSTYARQFLQQMEKPDTDGIDGLSPAIAIEPRTSSHNPRSTVGTVTEIYDYLRLLYARCGVPFCPNCDVEISRQSSEQIINILMKAGEGTKMVLMAPIVRGRKGSFKKELQSLRRQGYVRIRLDGKVIELEDDIEIEAKKKHDLDVIVDRLVIKPDVKGRLADSLETSLNLAEGIVRVEFDGEREELYSTNFACTACGFSFSEIAPRIFSFNNPIGACTDCDGLGIQMVFDPELIVPNPNLSLREGAIKPWERMSSVYYHQIIDALSEHYSFDIYTPFKDLSDKIRKMLLYGSGKEEIQFYYETGDRRHFYKRPFEGVVSNLKRRYHDAVTGGGGKGRRKGSGGEYLVSQIVNYQSKRPCPACGGSRLKKESLYIRFAGLSIAEIVRMPIREGVVFFAELNLPENRREVAQKLCEEIGNRLRFLSNVGLDYLTLDRAATTLSGGESQRIRLAAQIGSGLMGVIYVLDEPSIGLHQRDNYRLIKTLKNLRDIGNTVIVVEHDEQTMLEADQLIDMGPGAGTLGGELVSQGTPEEVINDERSLTGQYLSGKKEIPVPAMRRTSEDYLVAENVSEHNLKGITVALPLGNFCCVTGVSGSGKSSLVIDTLLPALQQRLMRTKESAGAHGEIYGIENLDKVIAIDQAPIGRTPRSNPATYTGAFTHVRDLFAGLPEAKLRGYKAGRFSFNVSGGRCEACEGDGIIRIEMHFLPDIFVHCEVCGGRRYNSETLEVKYRGHSIADVLDLTIDQAFELFAKQPKIRKKLQTLLDVGLGYLTLGQSATTLSGGEAQRIKLARELARGATLAPVVQEQLLTTDDELDFIKGKKPKKNGRNRSNKTIYILDEPTTGLHFDDIARLLEVLNRLVNAGHTVLVIEHNLDVIKSSDYVMDLGPEGGDLGGEVVVCGTPEELAACEASYTGQYLRKILNRT
jgi:excinuclease ABC subunit A